MRDDYLWDGSGEPDPEVQRLEKVLGRLRSDRPARVVRFPRIPVLQSVPLRAAAAGLLLVLAGTWLVTRPPRAAWEVARLEGSPMIGADRVNQTGRLAVGEWLRTDGLSRAQIKIGRIGQVNVEPNTLLRLLAARWTDHRLALERGEIRARIWAPPRLFFVETPSAVAVDLGCAYTLKVDEAGVGLLHVSHGWVAFELAGRESMVPAGASCVTRPGIGPGTPYYEDASEAFRQALANLDFENGGPELLEVLLAESRRRDVLTLWHLLSRTRDEQRGRVYDRMAALTDMPEGVSREGILQGDRRTLQLLWDELALDEAGWWR